MAQAAIPFSAATHRYREKFYTTTWGAPTGGTTAWTSGDASPPGGVVKSAPPYLRAIELCVTTKTAGSSGGTYNADSLYNFFSQVAVTQPGGEEMFGGPTFSGFHAGMAALHSGWKYANDPQTLPSWNTSVTSPQFVLPIVFEIHGQFGIGSLPNADATAPWKIQLTTNGLTTGTSGGVYQTAPTTTNPTMQVDYFNNGWTLPSPTNPLNPNLTQEVAPAMLGTLNKWTVQQVVIPASSSFNANLVRKGNAMRNLVFILRGASNARQALSNYPDPFTVKWDGSVLRANDKPLLVVDDEYKTRGGQAAATATTPWPGVMALQMADLAGLDDQAVAQGLGMDAFWGTTQTATLELDGTWGANGTLLEILTNDTQWVNLAGNPYAFAYGGWLQAPAQPSSRT